MFYKITSFALIVFLCSCSGDKMDYHAEMEAVKLTYFDKPVESKKKIITLITQFPEQSEPYSRLAEIYLIENKEDSAFLLNSMAMKLDSLNPLALTLHGDIYSLWGEHDKAFKYYHRAYIIDSARSIAYHGMSMYYLRKRNFSEAAYLAKKGFQIDSSLNLAAHGLVIANLMNDTATLEFYKNIILKSKDTVLIEKIVEYLE